MTGLLLKRVLYGLCCLLTIGVGILWRSKTLGIPLFAAKYGGDALWALMVFLGMGVIWPVMPTRHRALLALLFSFAIEFSQIYHAPWIDALRATRLGALVLGSVFAWPDLAAYAVGIACGLCAEMVIHRFRAMRGGMNFFGQD